MCNKYVFYFHFSQISETQEMSSSLLNTNDQANSVTTNKRENVPKAYADDIETQCSITPHSAEDEENDSTSGEIDTCIETE
jgi:hypothetical protein